MNVMLAKSAGFCFGVDRAINKAYSYIGNKNIYSLGPIINNEQVVNDLINKGIKVINSIENIHTIKDGTLIIRSHGIAREVYSTINKNKISIVDTTCPYVKRIHKIVDEYSKDGYKILIIGNNSHPEIQGIVGWCNTSPIVINSINDLNNSKIDKEQQLCIVAQTTFNNDMFEEIVEIVKKKVYDVIVFNTICSATNERQNEAKFIAKQVDKMIIIGGKHSSNTQKLYEICKKYCRYTYYIETIKNLDISLFDVNDTVGITAGASTPNNIIEEVYKTMSDLGHENSFEKLLEESLVSIHNGKIIKGTVIDVNDNEIILNIGYKSDGIITKNEFTNHPDAKLSELVHIGDELEAKVLKVNDREGQVLLTYKRLAAEKGYKRIEEALKSKEVITAKVAQVLDKGLVLIVDEARVFIPASLISDQFEKDLRKYLNQELDFQIIEYNPRKRRIIGSRKELIKKAKMKKQKEIYSNLKQGMIVKGRVKNVTDFGAFIDLGGVDGLLHISQMSWGRIVNPNQILKVNDEIEVLIKDIDEANKKIALSLKFPDQNPWLKASEKYAVGNVIEGKVARMTDFGAFIELEPGIDALLHVSQISKEHVEKPSDVLKVGQNIKVKVVDFNEEGKKISLSIKALEEDNNK